MEFIFERDPRANDPYRPRWWLVARQDLEGHGIDLARDEAARADPQLYELLALVDAIRIGRARERKLAEQHLTKRLKRSKPSS